MSENTRVFVASGGVEYNIDLIGGEAITIYDHLQTIGNKIKEHNDEVLYYNFAANNMVHALEALLTDEAVLGGE